MIKLKYAHIGKTLFLSKKYHHFVALIIISVCIAYSLILIIAYSDHKETYNKRSVSIARMTSYSFEFIVSKEDLSDGINIKSILKKISGEIKDKGIQIAILDVDHNISGKTESGNLPKDIFRTINCGNSENILIKSNNTLYLASQSVRNYPFCVVAGIDKDDLYLPLKRTFIQYFLILSIITIILLSILNSFYKTIINPISQISNFAKQILNHDSKNPPLTTKPQNYNFVEINDLNKIISKVGDCQRELKETNYRLYEAYQLRYEIQTKQGNSKELNIQEIVQKILRILYPEIYSKNLTIKQEYKVKNIQNIDGQIICDILLPILTRSCFFSMRDRSISIHVSNISLDNKNSLQITIRDEGVGNEEWRSKNVDDEEFLKAKNIINNNGGSLCCLENKGCGVRYCILLLGSNSGVDVSKSNVIELFA